MAQLRKDYILDRYVIIATNRGKRPDQFVKEAQSKHVDVCFFCPGNESMTPEEDGRLEDHNGWYIRWFENKFPAVKLEGNYNLETHNEFYTFSEGYGKHEVIVESPNHEDELSDLTEKHLASLLIVYKDRINELRRLPGIKYVLVMKNHLPQAGTSIAHTHSQVFAYNIVPTVITEKINATKKYNYCPYCEIINREKNSERRCFENDSFISFTPYASRFPMEILIMPKKHANTINDFNTKEINDLASMLKKIYVKLRKLNAPFNYYIHYSPEGENLHFQIEIIPRLATWAGVEYGTGTIINAVTPEAAAEFYRKEE